MKRRGEEDTDSKKKRKEEEGSDDSDLDENVKIAEISDSELDMTNDEFVEGFIAEGKGIDAEENKNETSLGDESSGPRVVHSTGIEDDLEEDMPPNQEHYHKLRYEKLENEYMFA